MSSANQPSGLSDPIRIGPQPSLDDLKRLKAEGVQCVINFREDNEQNQPLSPHDEGNQVREMGMEYLHAPISSRRMKEETVGQFLKRFPFLPQPVYAHCQGGKRAAAVMLIQRAREAGWNGEETLQRADELGLGLTDSAMRTFVRNFVNNQLEGVASGRG